LKIHLDKGSRSLRGNRLLTRAALLAVVEELDAWMFDGDEFADSG
jgi:hypothetical protein